MKSTYMVISDVRQKMYFLPTNIFLELVNCKYIDIDLFTE